MLTNLEKEVMDKWITKSYQMREQSPLCFMLLYKVINASLNKHDMQHQLEVH